ncbi:type VII secretion protein EccE [Micromonospora zingiberis]|uniref:Type VII secretion protein EccE n=1 Tax=Micromonospora zingiberis TaxID=2053011 RepID=A0A4R0GBU9_9ACTN|nr:type VII secretion protein EccE [Micromonospora zingiberis]TCB92798.1 type VII secretion protein EccE [Micromonospora zingiberis]
MTGVSTALQRPPASDSAAPEQRIPPAAAASGRGDRWWVHRPPAGQFVAAQVALATLVAALGRGTPAMLAATLLAAALLILSWCRVRQRWLYEWLGTGLGYLTRPRLIAPDAGPAALLDLVAPNTVLCPVELAGSPAAMLDDPGGVVALLELGDRADLLGDGGQQLPSPASLLSADPGQAPPVRVQLVLSAAPAPAIGAGGGLAATSYRQLTEGRLVGWERAVLAVRVTRAEGWSEEALRRALASAVRRIVRRLGPLPVRPLGEQAALRVLAELAHHDGRPVRESWQAVRSGGLLQTTFRLRRWPPSEAGRQLVPRLLTLPAAATTVSLHAESGRAATAGLTVRISAPTPAELSAAARALRGLVTAAGGTVQRLDGAHLSGLAGTLPLAPPVPAATGDGAGLELPYGSAGLVVGANRHGEPVTVRLFRPESTRVMIVGGVRAAQLMTMRAMALGSRVVVQTTRPLAWQPFVRGVGPPGETIPLVPPGRPMEAEPGTPLSPVLVVLDAPPPTGGPRPGAAWHTTLLVRDELTSADADALGRADLAVLQPLSDAEAAIAGAALGLGGSAGWLTRIRHDMVAVVNRRALRWAVLAGTPMEAQLVGRPSRD